LRLLPPGCTVEDVRRRFAFEREHGENFRGKAADGGEIARIALKLLPPAGIRRQEQAVDAAPGHLAAHDLVAPIALFER